VPKNIVILKVSDFIAAYASKLEHSAPAKSHLFSTNILGKPENKKATRKRLEEIFGDRGPFIASRTVSELQGRLPIWPEATRI